MAQQAYVLNLRNFVKILDFGPTISINAINKKNIRFYCFILMKNNKTKKKCILLQVETIGDAYMVVGGCPVKIPDHASQVATMALDLLHQSGKFKIRHLPKTPLRLRIGIHSG